MLSNQANIPVILVELRTQRSIFWCKVYDKKKNSARLLEYSGDNLQAELLAYVYRVWSLQIMSTGHP